MVPDCMQISAQPDAHNNKNNHIKRLFNRSSFLASSSSKKLYRYAMFIRTKILTCAYEHGDRLNNLHQHIQLFI